MVLPRAAVEHYQQQQVVGALAAEEVGDLWSMMGENFDYSWSELAPYVFGSVLTAQRQAASDAIAYVPQVLAEQGIDAPAAVDVNADRFIGFGDDGQPLETLIHGAVYEAKALVGAGATTSVALAKAGDWLNGAVLDAVREANRQAAGAAMIARPKVTGWVRMLNPPSCRFCITLAGKWYRWNEGFSAHPECDCRHIPSSEAVAGDITVDPYAYFQQLTEAEQNRIWGRNDAQAIRDGADIYRVTNIRTRGLANPNGRMGWQARRYGTPTELTVDDIYRKARTRDEAIEMLERSGFVTGEQVAGGNILGNDGLSAWGSLGAGQMGRGGTRRGATMAYRTAIRSGVRDPLEPATQTAAERRLHSAFLAKQAVDQGRNPFTANSARNPLTAEIRSRVNRDYEITVRSLQFTETPEQVRVLARLLGIL